MVHRIQDNCITQHFIMKMGCKGIAGYTDMSYTRTTFDLTSLRRLNIR